MSAIAGNSPPPRSASWFAARARTVPIAPNRAQPSESPPSFAERDPAGCSAWTQAPPRTMELARLRRSPGEAPKRPLARPPRGEGHGPDGVRGTCDSGARGSAPIRRRGARTLRHDPDSDASATHRATRTRARLLPRRRGSPRAGPPRVVLGQGVQRLWLLERVDHRRGRRRRMPAGARIGSDALARGAGAAVQRAITTTSRRRLRRTFRATAEAPSAGLCEAEVERRYDEQVDQCRGDETPQDHHSHRVLDLL